MRLLRILIEREKNIYKEQMLNEGKPEQIIDKIVLGKLDKFYSQICLLEQEFIKDTDKTVASSKRKQSESKWLYPF